jgi:hypothetical protein
MKGLELSECFYQEVCAPMLQRKFRRLSGRIAAGLVGEGSECLELDDELSRDHDWGFPLFMYAADCRPGGMRLAGHRHLAAAKHAVLPLNPKTG